MRHLLLVNKCGFDVNILADGAGYKATPITGSYSYCRNQYWNTGSSAAFTVNLQIFLVKLQFPPMKYKRPLIRSRPKFSTSWRYVYFQFCKCIFLKITHFLGLIFLSLNLYQKNIFRHARKVQLLKAITKKKNGDKSRLKEKKKT